MDYYDICTKREYEENGEKKAKWFRVGNLKVTSNGRQYIRLFQQPNTTFYVFSQDNDEKEQPLN